MDSSATAAESAVEAGLRYVSDSEPGISRRRSGRGFSYRKADGSLLTDPKEIDRIRRLAIPPAYRDVWICSNPRGHLQATGLDDRGRKQYRYHARFREFEEQTKFARMLAFGLALPSLRNRLKADFEAPGLPKQKVLAVVVYLLERSLIRIGNESYARENKSYGLTTLRNRHVEVTGENIMFEFMGKSKVKHRIEVHDRRLARVVRKLQDLPGQELFQYVDDEGSILSLTSADVNAYLQEVTGERFTAKDFRTWWGTVLALFELSLQDVPESEAAAKRAINGAMKAVSSRLGNTPAVCRKGYVHPGVFDAFRKGVLSGCIDAESDDPIACAEATLLKVLKAAP